MDDKQDVHICGCCLKRFRDVEEFISHKNSECQPSSTTFPAVTSPLTGNQRNDSSVCSSNNTTIGQQIFTNRNNSSHSITNVSEATSSTTSSKTTNQSLDFKNIQKVLSHDKQHLTALLAAIVQQAGISLESLQAAGAIPTTTPSTTHDIAAPPQNTDVGFTSHAPEVPLRSILVDQGRKQNTSSEVTTSYVDILNVSTTAGDGDQALTSIDGSLFSQSSQAFCNSTNAAAATVSSKNPITIDASQVLGVSSASKESLQQFTRTVMAPQATCQLGSGVEVYTNPVVITARSRIENNNADGSPTVTMFNEAENQSNQLIVCSNADPIQNEPSLIIDQENGEAVSMAVKESVLQNITPRDTVDVAMAEDRSQTVVNRLLSSNSQPVMVVATPQNVPTGAIHKQNISANQLTAGLDVKKEARKPFLNKKNQSRSVTKIPHKGTMMSSGTRPMKKHFVCCYKDCSYATAIEKDLSRHIRTHTGERPFACKYCSKTFPRNDKLLVHIRLHTGERPYRCQFCDYAATENSSLKKHLRIHTDERPFKCQVCPYASRNSSQLVVHLRSHTGDTPFECQMCDSKFKIKTDLRRHMRIHTGEKPYICPYDCGYKSSVSANLKSHVRINHSGNTSIACTKCEFRSSSMKNLREHSKIHDSVNPVFRCSTCEYLCSSKGALKNHQLTHSDERPFKCSHCSFATKQRGNLKIHLRKRHSDKYQEVRKGKHRSVMELKKTNKSSEKDDEKNIVDKKGFMKLKIKPSCKKLYNCSYCKASFVREDSLKAHLKQHKEIKQVLQNTALAVLQLRDSMPEIEHPDSTKNVTPSSGAISDGVDVSCNNSAVTETYVEVLATQSPVNSDSLEHHQINNQINVLPGISSVQPEQNEIQQNYSAGYHNPTNVVDQQTIINHIEIPDSNIGLHSIATAACNMQAIPISTNSLPVTDCQQITHIPSINNSVHCSMSLTPQILSDHQCVMTLVRSQPFSSETTNSVPVSDVIDTQSSVHTSLPRFLSDEAGTVMAQFPSGIENVPSCCISTGLTHLTSSYADSTATSMSQPLLVSVSSNLQLQGVIPQSAPLDGIQAHHVIQTPPGPGLQVSLLPLSDNISTVQQLPIGTNSDTTTNTMNNTIIAPQNHIQSHHIEVPVNIQLVPSHLELPSGVNQLPIQLISPRLGGGLQTVEGNLQQNPVHVILPQQYQHVQHNQTELNTMVQEHSTVGQIKSKVSTIVIDSTGNTSQGK